MPQSSFLQLASGGQVRFDFTAPNAGGDSALGFQLLDAAGAPLGGEVSVAVSNHGPDTTLQVDNFNAAALSGGGFVVADETRVFGPGVVGGDGEALTATIYDAHGAALRTIAIGIGVGFPESAQFATPGVFGLSGDGFGLVYERHDAGDRISQHFVFARPDGADLGLDLPAQVNSVSTAHGDLTLGFVGTDSLLLAGGNLRGALTGQGGADTALSGAGGDVIRTGDGNDSLQGGAGFDDLNGNRGDDTVAGGAGGDWLRGGQGNDSLSGGSGDDWLSGDLGNDTLAGGSGADTFHASPRTGSDVILDFNAAEGDHILLDPGTTFAVSQVGDDVLIRINPDDDFFDTQLLLKGVQLSTLPPGFVLLG